MTTQDEDKRLKILDEGEIDTLFARPTFTDEERQEYFLLSPIENAALKDLAIKSRIYCILQLGYFKARQQFFVLDAEDVRVDVNYICQLHFPDYEIDNTISKDTRTKHQRLILDLCQYRLYGAIERQKLEAKAALLAKVSSKPIYIFRELMHFLTINRIVSPAYSTFQDAIGKVLEQEKLRLIDFAKAKLLQTDIQALKELLTNPEGLHEITRLKRSPRDFGFQEMKQEIARGEQIRDLYYRAEHLIPLLEISNEGIKYYASLVAYYSVFRLRQLDEYLVYIYLLCFIFHRFQRFQDNLIGYFIHQIRRYVDEARQAAKDVVAAYRLERNRNLQRAGQVLQLFNDDTIPAETPFGEVRSRAFKLLKRPQLDQIAQYMVANVQLDEQEIQWLYLESKAQEFKRRLRRVVRTVSFATAIASDPLLEALSFMKQAFQERRALWHYPLDEIPVQIIPENLRRYLYHVSDGGRRQLSHDRYEFFIYRSLRNRLEAGDAFCHASIRFRSLEDDLLSDEQWQQKDILIAESDLPLLQQPIQQQLAELREMLENRLITVNARISAGKNDYVAVKNQGKQTRWTLTNPKRKVPVNHPFFDAIPLIDIHTLMHMVDQQTHFMAAFDHILHRYAARTADNHTLVAALVAWGTNLGLGRMGTISDLDFTALSQTSSSFIRLETLQTANDIVVNSLAQLPVFPLYHIDDVLHSSSDGQKYETRLHTFNARHSPKYFGLQKGVVSYTLVANHVPLNARIIGANEHESHYVYDLLANNTTDVQPTIHSTDTHGTNEVNFALLHFFGYQFAPRYKDLYDKVNTSLYGFQHPSQYDDDWLLKPIRKIRESLIVDEWENIQRIILSLALKTTTQYVIVSKLSSYARRNRTKRALWEYDNVIRSIYLLDFIDLLTLRRNVQRALNRGESYHQLRRAVSYANFGKLRFKSEHDQQIWNECSRLITNCIIFYNISLLSKLLEVKQQQGDLNVAQRLSRISPVAWQHVNFHGRYEFTKIPTSIDLDALIAQLASRPLVLDDAD
jgi:TnpA family transposase